MEVDSSSPLKALPFRQGLGSLAVSDSSLEVILAHRAGLRDLSTTSFAAGQYSDKPSLADAALRKVHRLPLLFKASGLYLLATALAIKSKPDGSRYRPATNAMYFRVCTDMFGSHCSGPAGESHRRDLRTLL